MSPNCQAQRRRADTEARGHAPTLGRALYECPPAAMMGWTLRELHSASSLQLASRVVRVVGGWGSDRIVGSASRCAGRVQ